MSDKNYRLRYLPLFYKDLDEKVTYIAEKLKNPQERIMEVRTGFYFISCINL